MGLGHCQCGVRRCAHAAPQRHRANSMLLLLLRAAQHRTPARTTLMSEVDTVAATAVAAVLVIVSTLDPGASIHLLLVAQKMGVRF